ncbi:hypothetical protein FFIC_283540 [Fructobacillus ficulneus]|uniref:Uncharacterized protein n=1 Tax=Fructobacillus ficulneus TaxID=157463 RepID=A0A0K8MIE3_9LACO|nr:hypothetical protein FFIC_283540 [Fructobacillus ficulneus]
MMTKYFPMYTIIALSLEYLLIYENKLELLGNMLYWNRLNCWNLKNRADSYKDGYSFIKWKINDSQRKYTTSNIMKVFKK